MKRAGSPPPPDESGRRSAARRPLLKSLFRTRSRPLAREIAMLDRALDLPTTILIQGDSGTGKDRLARALHDASNRRDRPFVRVEAANLSDDLFESELFGHERGAFTGAVSGKRGLLEVAADGTVYLDEVSSLSLAGQAKFLRVLQERTFRRLGGVVVHPFRARLVVSSRRDLSVLVREKIFRDDFFYRIDVVSVSLPRLSDRPEDILPLARQCLKESAREYARPARRFSDDAEELLSRHPWPGNVRELFHVIQKATLTAESAVVSAADLPASGSFGSPQSLIASAVERRWTLKELSDAYVDEILRRSGGNRSLAAKRLGVSRKSLWERARKKAAGTPRKTPRDPGKK